eukprot:1452214-Rhodomonas_salina.4
MIKETWRKKRNAETHFPLPLVPGMHTRGTQSYTCTRVPGYRVPTVENNTLSTVSSHPTLIDHTEMMIATELGESVVRRTWRGVTGTPLQTPCVSKSWLESFSGEHIQ